MSSASPTTQSYITVRYAWLAGQVGRQVKYYNCDLENILYQFSWFNPQPERSDAEGVMAQNACFGVTVKDVPFWGPGWYQIKFEGVGQKPSYFLAHKNANSLSK